MWSSEKALCNFYLLPVCHLLGRDQERQDLKPGGAKGVVSDFVVCLDDNEPLETAG